MRFWDSSAIVPLLVEEASSAQAVGWYEGDPVAVVWWGTPIECISALARLERDGGIESAAVAAAVRRLQILQRHWHEVQPGSLLRETAQRMLRVHPLRSMDALQLAAALTAAENRPTSLEFVCLDARLATAAQKEGFPIVGA